METNSEKNNITKTFLSPYVLIESCGEKENTSHRVIFKVDHQSFTIAQFDDNDEQYDEKFEAIEHAKWIAKMLNTAIERLIKKEHEKQNIKS